MIIVSADICCDGCGIAAEIKVCNGEPDMPKGWSEARWRNGIIRPGGNAETKLPKHFCSRECFKNNGVINSNG